MTKEEIIIHPVTIVFQTEPIHSSFDEKFSYTHWIVLIIETPIHLPCNYADNEAVGILANNICHYMNLYGGLMSGDPVAEFLLYYYRELAANIAHSIIYGAPLSSRITLRY